MQLATNPVHRYNMVSHANLPFFHSKVILSAAQSCILSDLVIAVRAAAGIVAHSRLLGPCHSLRAVHMVSSHGYTTRLSGAMTSRMTPRHTKAITALASSTLEPRSIDGSSCSTIVLIGI